MIHVILYVYAMNKYFTFKHFLQADKSWIFSL